MLRIAKIKMADPLGNLEAAGNVASYIWVLIPTYSSLFAEQFNVYMHSTVSEK